MRRLLSLPAVGLVALGFASWMGLQAASDEHPEKKADGLAGGLERPLHWSAQPPGLAPGLQVVYSWFIRFESPEGRAIPARVFLIERREAPSRIICLGHEIATAEGYAPDFDVRKTYVKPMGEGMFRVSLGNLEAFVRVVK